MAQIAFSTSHLSSGHLWRSARKVLNSGSSSPNPTFGRQPCTLAKPLRIFRYRPEVAVGALSVQIPVCSFLNYILIFLVRYLVPIP